MASLRTGGTIFRRRWHPLLSAAEVLPLSLPIIIDLWTVLALGPGPDSNYASQEEQGHARMSTLELLPVLLPATRHYTQGRGKN